ncbi:MAG: thiamine-phosphate kinase [Opitutaceae bacterium]
MLTSSINDQLRGLGESAFIREVIADFGSACPPCPHGPGDDVAVLPPTGRQRLVTTDPVILGRHFTQADRPADVAAKLIRRNLSDIAAMGGRPEAAILSMALTGDSSRRWLRAFIRALGREARRFGVAIVGGDCAQTDGAPGFFLTLLGESTSGRVLTRAGGQIGDALYVTGSLGGSRLGRQFRFQPRLDEGRWLAGRRSVHSMIDLSDGMAKDLLDLIPDGAAALIEASDVPIAPAARRMAQSSGFPALHHAFHDGEDFELLFTISARAAPERLAAAWRKRFKTRLTRIGRIVPLSANRPTIEVIHPPEGFLLGEGYEHFR